MMVSFLVTVGLSGMFISRFPHLLAGSVVQSQLNAYTTP